MVTYKKWLQVEACGEIDRSNPLETPEILVARVYATSVNMQVRNDHAKQSCLISIETVLNVPSLLPVFCVGHRKCILAPTCAPYNTNVI